MSAEHFLDTNLFICQLEARDEHKFKIADNLIREAIDTGNACISFQVIQECLNTMLRKADITLDSHEVRTYLEAVLSPLFQVTASLALYQRGIDIQARYKHGFYDSLIVAAALQAGCSILYSEDLHHGQTIEGLTIKNPFKR